MNATLPPPPAVTYPPVDAVRARYRPVAGPYAPCHRPMMERALATLSGCRVVVAAGKDGLEIWRLRAECETIEDTARKLHRPVPADEMTND